VTGSPAWPDAAAFLDDLARSTELGRRAGPLGLEAHLHDDLHVDSLGYVELAVVLADHGAVLSDDDWLDVHTLADVWFHYGFRRSNPVPPT
jgi:hypothetical protein